MDIDHDALVPTIKTWLHHNGREYVISPSGAEPTYTMQRGETVVCKFVRTAGSWTVDAVSVTDAEARELLRGWQFGAVVLARAVHLDGSVDRTIEVRARSECARVGPGDERTDIAPSEARALGPITLASCLPDEHVYANLVVHVGGQGNWTRWQIRDHERP